MRAWLAEHLPSARVVPATSNAAAGPRPAPGRARPRGRFFFFFFFPLPPARVVPAPSNAAAAADVAEGRADAGVSTALAAQRYGLAALASDVVDEASACTRFVLVGPPAPPPPRTGADRTSVVLRLANVPGALVSAMTEFAIRDIDLTRIESRPTRTELGTYIFFLDCVGHIDDDAVAEALKALYRRCSDVRFLGSWPTGTAAGAVPPALDDASEWVTRLREGRP
ncbi:hypothetical protein MPHL21000_08690 [Mycolicibacterium phlei DSM 43239 = CCUG 21000]|uniref:Prephenate dehydratase n=1 Tax=Mycolicibacterium phlei DSM 43239 = CCUG 21000 TaxID=1226750 RepID=A0A5N5V639_MYCPH|nr:hypothetical protein MPHL21000_08690 [Mycolicibacterium phlei DSM 43239 = CCUG 21000]